MPQEVTVVDPARTALPEETVAFLEGTGLNGPFVADLLSDMLAHERGAARLYRSVEQRTNNPVRQDRYRASGEETVQHVAILEQLMGELGSDPGPAGRGEGPRQLVLPRRHGRRPSRHDARTAPEETVEEVEVQEHEHLRWAQDTRCRIDLPPSQPRPHDELSMHTEEVLTRIRNLVAE